jgi:hypothetical protein
MKRAEAVALLVGCIPLANRRAAQGVNIVLTDEKKAAIAGFNKVWRYMEGYWLEDNIHREGGLNRSDIEAISFIAAMQAQAEMLRQHEAGEPLELDLND